MLTKWEAGEVKQPSKLSQSHNERLEIIVSNYHNNERLVYLRGIAHNFDF